MSHEGSREEQDRRKKTGGPDFFPFYQKEVKQMKNDKKLVIGNTASQKVKATG